MREITKDLLIMAHFIFKSQLYAARQQYGGTLRFVAQHSVLWGGRAAGEFKEDHWKGVCAGLSVEWMKAEADNRDFIKEVIDARNTILVGKTDRQFRAFAKRIEKAHANRNQPDRGLKAPFTLRRFVRGADYPFTSLAGDLEKGVYFYLSTKTHAFAGRSGTDGTVTFYDPNVGELRGTQLGALPSYLKAVSEASAKLVGETPAEQAAYLNGKRAELRQFTR